MTFSQKLLCLCALSIFGLHAHADTLVLCDSMTSELKGESVAAGAVGCIDVASFSWGASVPISQSSGVIQAGKPSLADFSLQKYVDSSSTSLFALLVSGATLKGTLQLREYGTCSNACPTPTPYFTVDLTRVKIASQSLGGSGDRPSESISFAYDGIKLCYRPQDPQTGMLQTQTCETYTISTGMSSN